jgi:site-specific DNA-adenine methylase
VTLRAPFPWFGGKSRVAHLVWERFGDVPNYVEPFAGSLAVLLGRPTEARIETVNDLDCYLANFWRALQADPEELARWADWPVNEADLHARHRWLVGRAEFRARMREDPSFYDVQIAGWWVWGIAQWIGGGWCTNPEWQGRAGGWSAPRGVHRDLDEQRPDLGTGNGVHKRGSWRGRADGTPKQSRPELKKGGNGVHRISLTSEVPRQPRVTLGKGGHGVHRTTYDQIPDISGSRGAAGRGVHASALDQKMPKADRGTASRLQIPRSGLLCWFEDLAARLRRVRVCCGDWHRILGPSPTFHIGTTGVFLDPPYSAGADRDPAIYGQEDLDVAHQVREWALANGDNPKLRIALCGYEGEHDMPAAWSKLAWTSQGGYGAQARARGRANRDRERIWFSPHCLAGTQPHLQFDQLEEGTR